MRHHVPLRVPHVTKPAVKTVLARQSASARRTTRKAKEKPTPNQVNAEPVAKPQADDVVAPVITRSEPGQPKAPAIKQTAAQAELKPAEIVQRIKDATVLVLVRAGRSMGSGSGFVFQADGDDLLIATNHHVVYPHLQGPEETATPQLARIHPVVTVIFRSGRGKDVEQSVPATVVASDRDGNRDLAILRVKKVRNPPIPIELADQAAPTETMPVLIYGFPFGNIDRMLENSAKKNPSITINKGSVSSLRTDEFGRLTYVQIDGSLNPGNSGGPVVDEQGKLVGVAVAQISNTTIGFAIPAAELTGMLDGRVGRLSLAFHREEHGSAELQVQAKLIDPMGHIKQVDLYYLPLRRQRPDIKQNADGTWPPLPGGTKVSLAFNPPIASAVFEADLTKALRRDILLQAVYTDDAGNTVYGNPVPYQVPRRPTSLASVGGAPQPGEKEPVKIDLAFAALGPLVDPVKNCKLERDESFATIEIPAGVHVLSPELNLFNAPMTLINVEGDFLAHVKIANALLPGTEPARFKRGVFPTVFQGAGLILWQDRSNYIRLEHTVSSNKRARGIPQNEIYLEIIKNGKLSGRALLHTSDDAVYLRLFRLKGAIQGMFSSNGKRWVILKKLAVPFPAKIQVGLAASNASKEPLSARFEEFILLTDQKAAEEAAEDPKP